MRLGDKKLEAVRAALECLARTGPRSAWRAGPAGHVSDKDIAGALTDVQREQARRAKDRAYRAGEPPAP